MSSQSKLLISFYGDDFTGSTDAMDALSRAGVRTALFLEPPQPEELSGQFEGLQAVGVAGMSRTMTPEEMDEVLPSVFERIKRLGAPLFHYKVCSTFDSSPELGSIGHAIDIGQEVFASSFVPLVVGAPALKRYCLFGNLFATVGDDTFRLDRHPTMSRHPVTPMRESDLSKHLSHQTTKKVALMDILHLTGTADELNRNLAAVLESKPDAVLFDVLDTPRLRETGLLIWKQCGSQPIFIVGSSGVEYALAEHWRSIGVQGLTPDASAGAVEQLLVVSGSCSPVTERQINWAFNHGFVGIKLNAARLVDPSQAMEERAAVIRQSLEVLARGASLILYSARGSQDSEIGKTAQQLQTCGLDPRTAGERLGEQLGLILRSLLEATGLGRAVVAGGDTSGRAMRQLGIYALEVLTPIAPGAPLCRAYSRQERLDHLEVALKGGQLGQEDFIERVRRGYA